ncbi:ComEA family DNA-binding protein [Catalinimonas niigatensis]|uniref:ComEA family DNA-binding protein n=1 Tax=Catalinimonas niigatensis TaxID=1397264 RepID=UPI002666EB54|nr:helix-hairpin-helix domain-containing protein [Catalinimonas niigatensis]WPP50513.1 helix-hairpin-helix domain-containing protein [Catalinimonas niigatensis]
MIKKLSFFIRDYFAFSRTETRGLFLLLSSVCIAIYLTIYFEKTAFESYQVSETDAVILDSLMSQLASSDHLNSNHKEGLIIERSLFLFDPNQASLEEFLQLGLDEKIANRIINYRSKGGKFFKADDLLKIYGFPQPLYDELRPYIHLPKKTTKNITREKTTTAFVEKEKTLPKNIEKESVSFDINEADSIQLSSLKGIGPVLSSRIVKYRDQLGGFHNKAQWKEIYKISDIALESLAEYAYINDEFKPKPIKINEVDFKTLLKHPYIEYELAKAIMNHRRIYGNFSSPQQLQEVYQMKEELLVKLLPYIVI